MGAPRLGYSGAGPVMEPASARLAGTSGVYVEERGGAVATALSYLPWVVWGESGQENDRVGT